MPNHNQLVGFRLDVQRHALKLAVVERNVRGAEVTALLASLDSDRERAPESLSLLVRALANQSRLNEALACCDRWVAANTLDPLGHYLRSLILQELGDYEPAQRSLRRAVYFHPNFVPAHFESGNPLPESDGPTVNRLTEIIASLAALAVTP